MIVNRAGRLKVTSLSQGVLKRNEIEGSTGGEYVLQGALTCLPTRRNHCVGRPLTNACITIQCCRLRAEAVEQPSKTMTNGADARLLRRQNRRRGEHSLAEVAWVAREVLICDAATVLFELTITDGWTAKLLNVLKKALLPADRKNQFLRAHLELVVEQIDEI